MTESNVLGLVHHINDVYRAELEILTDEANEGFREVCSKKRVRVVSVDRLLEIGEWSDD